jgi:hypothetical protein
VATGNLPEELEQFIAREFRSIEHLEILLLLRNSREKWWQTRQVFDVIRSSPQSVCDRLEELCGAGFVERSPSEAGSYRYLPTNSGLADRIEQLAEAYKSRRVAVIEAIYGRRDTPASQLARAFKIKRTKQ